MRWKKAELEKYVQAKEYVDTIFLPLTPFQLGSDEDAKKNSLQNELINIFAHEIEKELSGRIMLVPNYYYINNKEDEVNRINSWINDMRKQPFEHIILFTFDAGWKKYEKELQGNVLWLPGMQTGDLHSQEMQSVIRDQIAQVSEIIRSYW